MEDLVNALEKVANGGNERGIEEAKRYLENADLADLLTKVSEILLHSTKYSQTVRDQAVNQLKHATNQERWLQLPLETRDQIKSNCFEALGTAHGAQCIGYIACVELPLGLWDDCIGRLMKNVTDGNEMLREVSQEVIAYIRQNVPGSDSLLTMESRQLELTEIQLKKYPHYKIESGSIDQGLKERFERLCARIPDYQRNTFELLFRPDFRLTDF